MKHKHISKLALAAVFWFFSCTSVERDNCLDSGGINYMKCQLSLSSSSVELSSSSVEPSSSSDEPSSSSSLIQTGIIHGTPVHYEDEIYNTVVIGTQTWMARNLNYAVSGSKCGGTGTSILDNDMTDDNTATCDAYGRLYDWATAMALPPSCNSSTCEVESNHKGICPDGWHIPSDAEWTTLTRFVGRTSGTKLMATSDLCPYDYSVNKKGTDIYGFAALPGGCGNCYSPDDSNKTNYVCQSGYWWTASETGIGNAYYLGIGSTSDGSAWRQDVQKNSFYSVRCLKN